MREGKHLIDRRTQRIKDSLRSIELGLRSKNFGKEKNFQLKKAEVQIQVEFFKML